MATIATLAVNVTARTAPFMKAMKRVSARVVKLQARLGAFSKRIAKIGAVAAGVAVAGLVALTRQALKTVDALGKTSDRLGIATERLAGMHRAAALSGVEVKTLEKSLQNMTRNVVEAGDGIGEAKEAIKLLGLDAAKLAKKSPDAIFRDIADAMNQVKSQTDRVRIAFDIFGGRGVQLLNVLQLGRSGLEAIDKDVQKFGLSLSRIDVAKVEEANDAFTRLKDVFRGIGQTIAVFIAPVIKALSDSFTDSATKGEGLGKNVRKVMFDLALSTQAAANVVESAWTIVVSEITESFADFGASVVGIFESIIKFSADLTDTIGKFLPGGLTKADRSFQNSIANFKKGMQAVSEEQQRIRDEALTDPRNLGNKLAKFFRDALAQADTRVAEGIAEKIRNRQLGVDPTSQLGDGAGPKSRVSSIKASEVRFGGAGATLSGAKANPVGRLVEQQAEGNSLLRRAVSILDRLDQRFNENVTGLVL